jgi:hypothetical protein
VSGEPVTTYSAKLQHNANGTARLVLDTKFVNSECADKFLAALLALIERHEAKR